MTNSPRWLPQVFVVLASLSSALGTPAPAQSNSPAAVIHGIDASVAFRDQNIASYTVTEHYKVFRNQKRDVPAAEMTVKTSYERDKGKSFSILNETGSELLRSEVLGRVLDNERILTQPANRTAALIDSNNYIMTVKGDDLVEGRTCVVLAIVPRRNSPYLFNGDVWVDAQDDSIVKFAGTASRSPSMLTGPATVTRRYSKIDGFPMATRASATSNSWLLGQTTIEIEYSGYDIKLRPAQ